MRRTSRVLAATVTLALLGVPGGVASTSVAGSPPQTSITTHVSRPLLILGQATRVFGEVEPRERGVRVALQRKLSSGWVVVAVQKSNGRGKYAFKVEPTTAGRVAYRSVRLTRTGEILQRSAKVVVTTYRWHNVTDLNTTEDGANVFDGPASIGGTSYPHSIVLDSDDTAQEEDGPGFVAIDTTRRCAALTAVMGALDGNTAGTIVRSKVTGDVDVISDKTYAVGVSETVLLDVRGYSEVRIDTVAVQQNVERRLGVGTPRMLCAFQPLVPARPAG